VKTEAEIRAAMNRLKVVGERVDGIGGGHDILSASISGGVHFAQWVLNEGPDMAEVIGTALEASLADCQRELEGRCKQI